MFSLRRAMTAAAAMLLPVAAVPLLLAPPTNAAIPAASLGSSMSTAAGSCWEIKQKRSSAPSGVYWLLTPSMSAPAEFYCDQSTDGGGWVLIGKGREGWTTEYAGKGSPAALKSPDTVPMSSTTVQLHSRTVDELLDGGRVDALPDGIRLRRATNRSGTSWQEGRFGYADKSRWTWTLGAEHQIASWKFGIVSGRGGTSASFGSGSSTNRVISETGTNKKWKVGFGFGSLTRGYTDSGSYLWAATNNGGHALPYTQVYLRPRVTSDSFTQIGDQGTAAKPLPATLNSNALVSPWGVAGLKGSTSVEGNVEVQAFTQSGSKMYVGGNFRYVQKDANGTGRVEQPYLAAFDVETGEWDPGFRPVLDEQVKALATLPDGTVVAGGNFSRANGSVAPAIVALDPVTGATRTSWNLKLENRTTGGVLRVRALEIEGTNLYIGGNFTHLSGGTAPARTVYTRSAARVDATTATPDPTWTPDFNGSVIDLDAPEHGNRVYASGYFSTSNGRSALRAAALQPGAGASLATPAWNPVWSNRENSYQQAIHEKGDRVFVGGAEHALFQFRTDTFARVAGNITKKGGDFQAVTSDDDLVYATCHCSQWTYSGAYTWENIGTNWKQADTIKWLGLWDARTGDYVPDFTPNFAMRLGSGPWAVEVDSLGRLWVGGDVQTVRTGQGQKFSGGFARFARADSTAPGVPGNFRVTSQDAAQVTLSWAAVGDPSGVNYEILRGDRTIATVAGPTRTITLPHSGTQRYFVRAIDRAGNVGASTSVLTVGPVAANTAPVAAFTASVAGRTVTFDGSDSSDDRGVTAWEWKFGDGRTATGPQISHTYAGAGSWTVTLTVRDEAGLTHSTQQTVVTGASTSTEAVPARSVWNWWYRTAEPASGWNTANFNASSWSTGSGVFGWGAPIVDTPIDTFDDPQDRPVAAYFRKTFQVDDAARVQSLVLDTAGDDGIVVYVNGVEVARDNMRDGEVTHRTYAPTARRYTAAGRLVVDVPTSLLVSGTNVVAAETHINYRRTPDMTFDLKATLVTE